MVSSDFSSDGEDNIFLSQMISPTADAQSTLSASALYHEELKSNDNDDDKDDLMAHLGASVGQVDEMDDDGGNELLEAVVDMKLDEHADDSVDEESDQAHALAALSMDKLVNFW